MSELPGEGPVFVVDAGDRGWKQSTIGRSRMAQQRLKAQLQHAALVLGGIDAMVPGEADLALGLEWLEAEVADHDLPMIAANLECGGRKPFEPSRTVTRDGVTVGFVGIIDPKLVVSPCTASNPKEAARAAIQAFDKPVDLIVALAHEPDTADRELAKRVPRLDLIVNGHGRRSNPVPARLPKDALQLGVGTRGKRLGIAQITLRSGGEGFHVVSSVEQINERLADARERTESNQQRIDKAKTDKARERAEARQVRLDEKVAGLTAELEQAKQPAPPDKHGIKNRLRALGEDIVDHPATAALVEAAKLEIGEQSVGPNEPSKVVGRTYLGSTMCLSCHPAQHAQWSGTGHASAWASLEKVNRTRDLDCWSCHVTGANQPGGPTHPLQVAGLENVGCEACHGPGTAHVQAAVAGMSAMPAGKAPMTRRPTEDTCTQCHDGIKDEGRFDSVSYFSRVTH